MAEFRFHNSIYNSALLFFFYVQGTIGSLDYPPEERKKLAKKSGNFACADCGSGVIVDLLKGKEAGDTEEVSSSTAEEAKEIIKTMSLKVCTYFCFEKAAFQSDVLKKDALH